MTGAFTFTSLPARIVFGAGRRAEVPAEIDALGVRAVFLVVDGSAGALGDELAGALGPRVAGRWNEVVQHVPIDLAERARAAVTAAGADSVVCAGGGSATGLAKAIALSHRVPVLAVPTTYAGSEQTTIYGLTGPTASAPGATEAPGAGDAAGDRAKRTGKDPVVLPRTVVYDPELTLALPPGVTGPSACNALAHSVEALWAEGHNPVTTALALDGVRAIRSSLPAVMADPANLDARSTLLYGAYLSGAALGTTATGLHHKLCHVLGGTFGLVHADTHSVLLPHVVAFNAPVLPDAMARLAEALGVPGGDPAAALWDLAQASRVPTSLAALGLRRDDLATAARRAAAELGANPRPVTEADVFALLERAHDGARPQTVQDHRGGRP